MSHYERISDHLRTGIFAVPSTSQQIAASLGLNHNTVRRVLGELQQDGNVRRTARTDLRNCPYGYSYIHASEQFEASMATDLAGSVLAEHSDI